MKDSVDVSRDHPTVVRDRNSVVACSLLSVRGKGYSRHPRRSPQFHHHRHAAGPVDEDLRPPTYPWRYLKRPDRARLQVWRWRGLGVCGPRENQLPHAVGRIRPGRVHFARTGAQELRLVATGRVLASLRSGISPSPSTYSMLCGSRMVSERRSRWEGRRF